MTSIDYLLSLSLCHCTLKSNFLGHTSGPHVSYLLLSIVLTSEDVSCLISVVSEPDPR